MCAVFFPFRPVHDAGREHTHRATQPYIQICEPIEASGRKAAAPIVSGHEHDAKRRARVGVSKLGSGTAPVPPAPEPTEAGAGGEGEGRGVKAPSESKPSQDDTSTRPNPLKRLYQRDAAPPPPEVTPSPHGTPGAPTMDAQAVEESSTRDPPLLGRSFMLQGSTGLIRPPRASS